MTETYRVLVVDDDAAIRETYRHILQPPLSEVGGLEALISGVAAAPSAKDEFRVAEADQGKTAALLQQEAIARGESFQLAFIDMRMPPGWDGMRTAVALRSQDPSIYIVIATAFSDYNVNELQAALGHDVVLLRKPFNQEEVYQLARTLCQSWMTRQRLETVTAELESRVLARTAELDRRMTQQQALAEIAAQFIAQGSDDVLSDAVVWSLARLARVMDVDACALFQLVHGNGTPGNGTPGNEIFTLAHEWSALGVPPLRARLAEVSRKDFGPVYARLLRGEHYAIRELAEMPAEMDKVRTGLTGHLESCLVVPMELGGRLGGFLVVGDARPRGAWEPHQGQLLRTASHVIARALESNEANRQILEKQSLLSATEHAAHIGSWRLEAGTMHGEADEEIRRIMGIAADQEINPALLATLVHPEDWPALESSLMSALSQGIPHRMDYRILRPDGEERWVSCWAEPQRDAGGRVLGLVGMMQDQTEQRRASLALAESETKFRAIVEAADEGIWQLDRDWNTIYVNRRMEQMLGQAPGSMLGRPLTDFMDAAGREQASRLRTHREQDVREIHDFIFQRADGGLLPTMVSATPVVDGEGRFAGATAMVTDISRRKHLESSLRATAEFVSRQSDEHFPRELVRHAAQTLGLDYVHIARLLPGQPESETPGRETQRVEIHAAWLDGAWCPNGTYDLANTPCRDTVDTNRVCIESDVRTRYPLDEALAQISAESYVGEPVLDMEGHAIGLIVGATHAPLRESDVVQANLRILAARAAAFWAQSDATRALRGERDTSRNILQTVEAIIVALDSEGQITLANRKTCELLGYSEAELLGQNWFATCLPRNQDVDEVRAIFRKALANDLAGAEYHENPVRTRSGEERLIAWHNSIIRDTEGKVIGGMSAGMDITESRAAERALHESERRFHRLIDQIPNIAVQGYDRNGVVGYWNTASEQLYGYTKEEAIGNNLLDLIIPPEMHDEVQRAVSGIVTEQQGIPPCELVLRHKDGSAVSVYSSHAVVSDGGDAAELFCLDIDLSHRKRLEAERAEAERSLETLLANLPGMAYRCLADENWTMLYVSAGVRELTGYSRDDLVGKSRKRHYAQIIHPEDRDQVSRCVGASLEKGKPFECRYRILCADGEMREVWGRGRRTSPQGQEPVILEGFIAYIPQVAPCPGGPAQ